MNNPNPFNLKARRAYQKWRERKLSAYPLDINKHFTLIKQANKISNDEIAQVKSSCQSINMAFYRFTQTSKNDKKHVHQLGKSVGLARLDSNLCADDDYLTSLRVTKHKGQHNYIPYTNKRLSWHTDGYYNKPNEQIYGMLLHCETPAIQGGENLLLDHEILYILLRDKNPDWIKALMQPQVMTIPENIIAGQVIRPARAGSVFSLHPSGHLHMRYSARLRNIIWKQDETTQAAVEFIQTLWKEASSEYILRYKLKAGEGLICNNILHRRTGFEDSESASKKRLLYRGRYYDRVK